MSTPHRVAAKVYRKGREATVISRGKTGEDQLSNPEFGETDRHTVHAMRTYPNRNTEVNSRRGDRHRDRALFVVPRGDDLPAVPDEDDHFVFADRKYSVKALTEWPTHVEFFGQPVREDGEI